jgi:hypothetical protein
VGGHDTLTTKSTYRNLSAQRLSERTVFLCVWCTWHHNMYVREILLLYVKNKNFEFNWYIWNVFTNIRMHGAENFKIRGAYKLSEYFAKPYFHKYWTETHDVTTIWKRNVCSSISDHDVQIAIGTRVEPPQKFYIAPIPGHTNYTQSVRQLFSLLQCFKLFPRDGSSD